MKTTHKLTTFAAALITFGSFSGAANAAIVLQIDNLSASSITFTVSGTVDSGFSAPVNPGVFFLTPFSPNINTEWISSASLVSSTIAVDVSAATVIWTNNGNNTGDALYFYNNFSVRPSAGTVVSGSATFSGSFDLSGISIPDFELYLGQQSARTVAASQLVATAVPEPSSILLFGLGAFGLAIRRHRINQVEQDVHGNTH